MKRLAAAGNRRSAAAQAWRAPILEALESRTLFSAITVTSLDDEMEVNGLVSLREAIEAANTDTSVDGSAAGSGADEIVFEPNLFGDGPRTMTLNGSELRITGDLTITGPGADRLTIDGNQASRILRVDDGADSQIIVAVSGLTLTGGLLPFSYIHEEAHGAGIYNREALSVTGCVFRGIKGIGNGQYGTEPGGGALFNEESGTAVIDDCVFQNDQPGSGNTTIYNLGAMSLADSRIEGHHGYGRGAVWNGNNATMSMTNCTVIRNQNMSTGNQYYAGIELPSGAFNSGNLVVINCRFAQNTGWQGALGNFGTLTLEDSTLIGNVATGWGNGGGVANRGTLVIERSTLSGNVVAAYGGAIYTRRGTVQINDSTINNNAAQGYSGAGGGLYIVASQVTITNTTISGNTSDTDAGAIFFQQIDKSYYYPSYYFTGALDIYNSTITENWADTDGNGHGSVGGIRGGSRLISSIVAGNFHGKRKVADNPHESDPMLGPLADNGGPTWTHALLPGSPAADAGSNPLGLATDQRGAPRALGDFPDIGAYESSMHPGPFLTMSAQWPLVEGEGDEVAVFTVTASHPSVADWSVSYSTADGGLRGHGPKAKSGRDYIATSGVLTVPAGQTTGTISVPIIGDSIPESDRILILTISDPVGARIAVDSRGRPSNTISVPVDIHDDDHSELTKKGFTVGSIFTPGQERRLSFHAVARRRYDIGLLRFTIPGATIELLDHDGLQVLAAATQPSSNPAIRFWTPASSGTYYLRITGATPDQTGSYEVFLNDTTPRPDHSGGGGGGDRERRCWLVTFYRNGKKVYSFIKCGYRRPHY